MCSHVVETLASLLNTRSKYIDDPLYQTDLHHLSRISEHWMVHCLTAEQRALAPLLSNDLQHLWSIIDLLFHRMTFKYTDDFTRYSVQLDYQ